MSHHNRQARAALLAAVLAAIAGSASAQTTANVSVTASSGLATIPGAGVGLNTAVYDGNLTDASVPGLLFNAGIGALRYPGGSTSDIYDWQTNSIMPGHGSYANPNNGFDAFMKIATSTGATPVLTVNYGSNTTGIGGGSPSLAAAWVQYANITKKYGVKYWEIGNEVYGNGEYGNVWETDQHVAHDPATYGANVVQFASAMKAIDPTIKIGAVLIPPGNWPDGVAPDWNSNVLAQCGKSIDFVILHWYPQNPGSESDAGLLSMPQGGTSGNSIANMVAKLRSLISQYAGANAANVQILVTEMNSVASDPGKQTLSVVNSMFLADALMSWLENGVTSVDVWDLHNGSNVGNNSPSLFGTATIGDYGVLSNATSGEPTADTPMPSYYGIQMVSKLGKSGDTMVAASSSNSLLSVHAVKQAGGNLALLLVNKDPSNSTTATVSVAGYTPAAGGTVYSYGKSSTAIASASLSGVSTKFPVTVAPYSLTTVVLTPASANTPTPTPSPSFTIADSPASLSLVQGASATSSITLTPSGGFTGSVSYTITGLPSGVTASFSTASGVTELTLKSSTSAATGTSVMTITGTSGALHAATALGLTVTAPPPPPSFTLSDSAVSLSVVQGASSSSTIAIAPANGFGSAVALAASGLPAGVTASFSPASATSSSTLTLTASASAAVGTGSITVTGTSGSLVKSVTVPVSVTAAATTGKGPASVVAKATTNGPWFDEDDVAITTSAQITALTLTVTVPASNVSYSGLYTTLGSKIVGSHTSGSNIVYTFAMPSGQVIPPGSFTLASQMNGNGSIHPASGDSWKLTYTAGGATYTQSGVF